MAQDKSSGVKKEYGTIIEEKSGKPQQFCDFSSIDADVDQKLAYELILKTSAKAFCDTNTLDFYLKSDPFKCRFSGIETLVHESLHKFTVTHHHQEYIAGYRYYYVDSTTIYTIRIFPGVIPRNNVLRDSVDVTDSWAKAYILGNASHGIYLLTEELLAYYQSDNFIRESIPWVDTAAYHTNPMFKASIVNSHYNNIVANYIFKGYILKYLKWIKSNDQPFYTQLKADTAFQNLLRDVSYRFDEVISQNDLMVKEIKNSTPGTERFLHTLNWPGQISKAKKECLCENFQATVDSIFQR